LWSDEIIHRTHKSHHKFMQKLQAARLIKNRCLLAGAKSMGKAAARHAISA
jgi:hypothetical protein